VAGELLFDTGALVSLPDRSQKLHQQFAEFFGDWRSGPDYADATLVVLAEELSTNLVFTTDRRDFAVYRIKGRRRFDVLPG